MKSAFLLAAIIGFHAIQAFADVDYIAKISENRDMAQRLGIPKLNDTERAEWNRILAAIYTMGVDSARQSSPANQHAGQRPGGDKTVSAESGGAVWLSRADLEGESIVKLRNGAIFEVSTGFAGIGYGREVALIKEGTRWSLWIEGKREFRGELLKPPSVGSSVSFRRSSIQSVSSDGEIVKLIDGSVNEIESLDRIDTSLWLSASEILIIGDSSMLNPNDSNSKIVHFVRLK